MQRKNDGCPSCVDPRMLHLAVGSVQVESLFGLLQVAGL